MNAVRPGRAAGGPDLLRITAARFSTMVEAGAFRGDQDVELRGGLLNRKNPRYVPHLRGKTALHEALLDAVRAFGSSLRVSSGGSVLLGEGEVPMPGLIVWEPVRVRGPVPGERVRLVVEVSDTTLGDDLGHKLGLYATASVPECWVANLPGRAIHQHWAPSDGAYARSAAVPFGQAIRSAALAVPTAALDNGAEPSG